MHTVPCTLLGIFATIFCTVTAGPAPTPVRPPKTSYQLLRLETEDAPPCDTVDSVESYNGIKDERHRWTGFYVQYDAENTDKEIDTINAALDELSQVLPCVDFGTYEADQAPEGAYIKINRNAAGCSSKVGKQRDAMQTVNLGNGCWSLGTVLHEFIHALGIAHEHSRPDRDDFVTIHKENIIEGKEHNFEKRNWDEWDIFGVDYNYHSIMHYKGNSFGINKAVTISAKNGEQSVGSLGYMQQTDKDKLKAMYNC